MCVWILPFKDTTTSVSRRPCNFQISFGEMGKHLEQYDICTCFRVGHNISIATKIGDDEATYLETNKGKTPPRLATRIYAKPVEDCRDEGISW